MLERLRAWRVPTPPDRGIGAELSRQMREITRVQRAVGGADSLWDSTVPPELAATCRVERVSKAGDFHVVTKDAASRYAIDVWLRSGGLELLRAKSSRGIRGVKLK